MLWNSGLHYKGLKRGVLELSGDNAEFFSDFFIGVTAEERNTVGKHGHLYVFGYDSPKVVDVKQE